MSAAFDYVTVGHVTCDVIEDAPGGPRAQPGGGAFYSALQAARLGLRALILTTGVRAEIERLLEPFRAEFDVRVTRSDRTTTLATRGSGGHRVQRVRAWAGPVLAEPLGVSAEIVHFAPVARELTASNRLAWADLTDGAKLVALTPQGLVRGWGDDGWISPAPLDLAALPTRVDAAVLNQKERESCQVLLSHEDVHGRGAVVAVTAGGAPVELHLPRTAVARNAISRSPVLVEPVAAGDVRDDLGAGDVFAAAFFVALARGDTPETAARRGSAAAAVRMSGEGPAAIGDTAAIDALL